MLIDEHLRRAESFEQSVGKLDPIEDTELFIVLLMRAATNRVNAAVHALDVTEEGPVAAGMRVGDLNHSYKPRLEGELPQEVQHLFSRLKYIEDLRPEYARGPRLLTAEIAESCRRAYADIVTGTDAIFARRKEAA